MKGDRSPEARTDIDHHALLHVRVFQNFSQRGALEIETWGIFVSGESRESKTNREMGRREKPRGRSVDRAVSRNKDLIGCVMARGPEEPPVPPRERLLGLRLPHGPL